MYLWKTEQAVEIWQNELRCVASSLIPALVMDHELSIVIYYTTDYSHTQQVRALCLDLQIYKILPTCDPIQEIFNKELYDFEAPTPFPNV